MPDIGSTVPRRQLGRYLKQAREEAGISLEAAARTLEWSKAKMYRIESGQTALRTHDVLAMCATYRAAPDLTAALTALATQTKAKGWWHSYADAVPEWFELYVGMEAAATRLRHYEPSLIPGLLQTREYAAAVFRSNPAHREADVEQLVELRQQRQRLLQRRMPRPPKLEVILDESVLRRPIADRAGMRGQLDHLQSAGKARNIELRVLPLVAGPQRASQTGAFVILHFPDTGVPQEPATIYSEGLGGALYLDKPHEVETYESAWHLLAEHVLDAEQSADLIESIKREYPDE